MKKLYRGSYIDASCQVWFNLAKEFQRRRFFNISQSETIIALDNHICWPNGMKRRNFIEDITQMFTAKFGSIWPISFRREDCFSSSQSETKIVLGDHICSRDEMKELDRAGRFWQRSRFVAAYFALYQCQKRSGSRPVILSNRFANYYKISVYQTAIVKGRNRKSYEYKNCTMDPYSGKNNVGIVSFHLFGV